MAAGLDSIAATDFGSTLTDRFNVELSQTVLFDHPTIAAVASFVVTTALLPGGQLPIISWATAKEEKREQISAPVGEE